MALGLYEDQPEIDANITDLHLPGEPVERAGALAPLLAEERGGGPRAFPQTSPPEEDPANETGV